MPSSLKWQVCGLPKFFSPIFAAAGRGRRHLLANRRRGGQPTSTVRLAAEGCIAALPVVVEQGQALQFRRWRAGRSSRRRAPWHDTSSGDRARGRPRHSGVAAARLRSRGWSLGLWGGYYDRTLAALRRQGDGRRRSASPMPRRRLERCRKTNATSDWIGS